MVHAHRHFNCPRFSPAFLLAAFLLPGCGVVPRSRIEESQKISQLLRAENASLKDRMLSLQSQNRDLSDRAVDDLKRLTAREEAIERLERSVQAYQDDRERLAAAYEQLTASLGRRPESSGTSPDPGRDENPSGPGSTLPKGITSVDDAQTNR